MSAGMLPPGEGGAIEGYILPAAEASTGDMPRALLEFHSPSAALIDLPPNPAALYITWLISTLAIAGIVVMSVCPLDQVVSAQGRLTSTDTTLVVQPLETAIIRSIDVQEGDVVHRGQVLAHLDPTVTDADVENMRQQQAAYAAQVARLTAEAEGRDYIPDPADPASVQEAAAFQRRRAEFTAKVENFDKQAAGARSDMQGSLADAAMYGARARVAANVYAMRLRLQRDQVGSRLSTLSAQNDLMEVERAQIAAQQAAGSARAKLEGVTAARDGFIQNWKATVYQDLGTAQHRLADAGHDYRKAGLLRTLIGMHADRDDEALNIVSLSVGSVMQAGNLLMTLVPVDDELEVDTAVRGSDVGFIMPGDPVLLKFATLPYTQYGGAEDTVRIISADSFAPDDGGHAAPGTGAQVPRPDAGGMEAYYRVRVRVDRYTLHGVPSFFHPHPGMPVEADIHVGRRTMMQYLLNRLVPTLTDGMREP
ncbi:HlyD family type I secretion periplasmic adaptor subunit [Gluconacetobacter diazotrophicus]|uniref:Membrane fusion protein (MFP) family protein n=1 Tax=Gluconacetobacter diazotrophicus (strain ATCC 49037 / DSM 5601 / CCUG 37298 / CIP 103539 / LMG 7603 / PAl5) TaxID=272568 RepID=A9H4I4_GLUDA|nr:HlyD family type I secretion periplasmic adaptor subunit [Gluconacetobacter diazotrophicus]CAP57441.1 putative secretion protein [Gluconacetobacter diazotrophicus PA1 5]